MVVKSKPVWSIVDVHQDAMESATSGMNELEQVRPDHQCAGVVENTAIESGEVAVVPINDRLFDFNHDDVMDVGRGEDLLKRKTHAESANKNSVSLGGGWQAIEDDPSEQLLGAVVVRGHEKDTVTDDLVGFRASILQLDLGLLSPSSVKDLAHDSGCPLPQNKVKWLIG